MWVVILITLSQGMALSVSVPVVTEAACRELAPATEQAFRAVLASDTHVWTVCQFDELLVPLEDLEDPDLEP